MKKIKQNMPWLLSGIIPFIVILSYFIYRGFYPFGHSSLLTVDMGQQYVAFYEYLRNTILHHPSQLLYSFSNGIGGDMFGSWAYYLFSPLNLLLLFFPGEQITAGILLITLLKYGLSGFSMYYFLTKTNQAKRKYLPTALSVSYSLMAFLIANQLNLFWLDACVMLPIIMLGLHDLIQKKKIKLFVISMSIMLIINYYFAFMIGIFSVLYFIFQSSKLNWKMTGLFLKSWIYVILLTAITWMPTLFALLQGKANYTEHNITWNFEYYPLKMLMKLLPGTFSFKQMSAGLPNIYVGMFVLIAFLSYFVNNRIPNIKKIKAGIITLFFLISFCIPFFDLLWHAMQFPWWYQYRFSYIFSFWMIMLAYESLSQTNKAIIMPTIILSAATISLIIVVALNNLKSTSDFMSINQIEFGGILFFAALILFIELQNTSQNLWPVLLIFITIDMGINAMWSLNRISYVSQTEFSHYSLAAKDALSQIKTNNTEFYRIGTNYQRAKNDAIQFNYNGGASFNSNLDGNMQNLMWHLGQPTTSGNVDYINGTLVTDSILGFKYWSLVDGQTTHNPFETLDVRNDISDEYDRLPSTPYANGYQNPYSLSIGILTTKSINTPIKTQNPIVFQDKLMQNISNQNQAMFHNITDSAALFFSNVNATPNLTNGFLNKQNIIKSASVTMELTPKNNNPIYLTTGTGLSHKNADIFINNNLISENIDYDHPIVMAIANKAKNKKVKIQIVLKNSTLFLSDLAIHELDMNNFNNQVKVAKQNALKNVKFTGNKITANYKNDEQKYLYTSIPYSQGWHILVDNHPIQTLNTNYSLGVKKALPSGQHKITFYFIPPYLILGLITSLLGILGFYLLEFKHIRLK